MRIIIADTLCKKSGWLHVLLAALISCLCVQASWAVQPVKVVIDAGHGGKDSGAIGPAGHYEKNAVLAIAYQLQNELSRFEGISAQLLRADDQFIELEQRSKLAAQMGADVLLSIHADAHPDEQLTGAAVFVLSSEEAPKQVTKLLQEEPAAMGDQSVALLLADLQVQGNFEQSRQLASAVFKSLSSVTPMSRAAVEPAQFAVLKHPTPLSLLIETGFMSNADEEQRLIDPEHQQALAAAIAKGVDQFLRAHPPAHSAYADQTTRVRYRVKSGDTLTSIAKRWQLSVAQLKRQNGLSGDTIHVGQILEIAPQ